MEYSTWAPYYREIQSEFGFPWDRETRAADTLRRLLPDAARHDAMGRISARLGRRPVVVVGLAPGAGAPPLWRVQGPSERPALIACDGATEPCLRQGLVPDVIATDLDGPVPSEVAANARGSLAVVHAHGDNLEAIEHWVPEFEGALAGSWAGPPDPVLLNVGGFTDGDRAVFLATHVGAARVLLWGFDFDAVTEPAPELTERKRRKLRWARRLIGVLARESGVPIDFWARDGSIRPYLEATGSTTQ